MLYLVGSEASEESRSHVGNRPAANLVLCHNNITLHQTYCLSHIIFFIYMYFKFSIIFKSLRNYPLRVLWSDPQINYHHHHHLKKLPLFIILIFLPMTVMSLNIHMCQRWPWKRDNHGLELRYQTAWECNSHLVIHPSLQFKRIIHYWKFLQYLCQDSLPKLQAF